MEEMREEEIANLADEIAEAIFRSFSERFIPKLRYIEGSMNKIISQQQIIINKLADLERNFEKHINNFNLHKKPTSDFTSLSGTSTKTEKF